jgi:hypothetical protein
MINAQIDINHLDSAFLNKLKSRIIFGVNQEGILIQQIERLYNSPKLEKETHIVWAGTEARILSRVESKAKLIECFERNLKNHKNRKLIQGWVSDSLQKAYSVYEILHLLNKTSKQSGIFTKIEWIKTKRPSEPLKVVRLTFKNTLNEKKTIHIYKPCFRDKLSGAPISGTLNFPPVLAKTEIGANQSKSLLIDITTPISLLKQKNNLVLYILYQTENTVGYYRMISDFIYID